jgi:predicted  nucleic acid-binding Zn-ribbon protein
VSTPDTPTLQQLQAEVCHLQEELHMRDQLVQQLSQELFRLVKSNSEGTEPVLMPERDLSEMRALQDQLRSMEEQVTFYQEQIAHKDNEISQLKQSVEELSNRCEKLAQAVQELPSLYRQKFAERMAPVKEKVAQIQRENRKLHAELQSVSYRLALKSRQSGQVDLPSFPHQPDEDDSLGLPTTLEGV